MVLDRKRAIRGDGGVIVRLGTLSLEDRAISSRTPRRIHMKRIAKIAPRMPRRHRLVAGVGIALSALILLFLYAVFDHMVERIPQGQVLPSLTVPVAKNGETVIGRRDLLQPKGATSAADNHFRIRRQDGAWYVANVTGARRALLTYDGFGSINANRWPLQSGDRIDFLDATVVFESVDHAARKIKLQVTPAKRAAAAYTLDVGSANKGVLTYGGGAAPAGWQAACIERPGW